MGDWGEELRGWRQASERHVFLRGLRVDCRIGVYAHEQRQDQPIVLSLELEVSADADATPILYAPPGWERDAATRAIVCYDKLSRMMRQVACAGHIAYVETLAERIAEAALRDGRVLAATVVVEKPQAIQDAQTSGVRVTLRRR